MGVGAEEFKAAEDGLAAVWGVEVQLTIVGDDVPHRAGARDCGDTYHQLPTMVAVGILDLHVYMPRLHRCKL